MHLAGPPVHLDVGHPRGPCGSEAGELAVHIACVGEALALEQVALRRPLLRPGMHDPSRALGGRLHELDRARVLQVPQAVRDRIDTGGGRQLVDVRLVRERIGQRRHAAQPRRTQDRRHVVRGDAQRPVVVGRHRRAVAHLVGRRIGLDGAGEQQRQRGGAVRRVRGLEVVTRDAAVGVQPARDLHELRRALGLPRMFLLAREPPHRPPRRRRSCARSSRPPPCARRRSRCRAGPSGAPGRRAAHAGSACRPTR